MNFQRHIFKGLPSRQGILLFHTVSAQIIGLDQFLQPKLIADSDNLATIEKKEKLECALSFYL